MKTLNPNQNLHIFGTEICESCQSNYPNESSRIGIVESANGRDDEKYTPQQFLPIV
jgi:hypothetical protein